MATFTKDKLSGSTLGKAILVSNAALASATTIHTANTNTSIKEEIWLYAQNTGTTTVKLTIGWGGTTDPDDLIELSITGESGLTLVVPGLVLMGNTTGSVIKANCNTNAVCTIHGYVNRIA